MGRRKALPALHGLPSEKQVAVVLHRELRRIESGRKSRKRQPGQSSRFQPWDNESGFLKREVYRLTNHFVGQHEGRAIEKRVAELGRVPAAGPSFEENPYHWTLLALQSGNQTISRADRRLFANQLLYAHQNDVPEGFLVGFIYQCDLNGKSLYDRVKARSKEPVLQPDLPNTEPI